MRLRAGGVAAVLALAACGAPQRLEKNPDALEALLRRGEEAESGGDGRTAGEAYEQAVRDFGDYSSAWSHAGEFRRFWKRDPAAGEAAFRKSIDAPRFTDDSVAFAWRGLGEIARSRGDVDRAIACFEKSLSIKPRVETHRSLSALHATERHDFEKAAYHAKAAVELSPDDPIALLQFAVQMVRFKKPQEAKAGFAKAIRLAGCDERGRSNDHVHCCVLYNGACYHAVRGDKAAALAMLKEFFLTPNHRHITRDEILKDPDFEGLVRDPEFLAMLDYRLPAE